MRALILAALLAACLAHAADSAAPRRSLAVDVFPAGPLSDSSMCRESLVTLCLCKRDLLASFLTGSPVPRVCCRAAEDVDFHCGPFTRAFVGLLLPRWLLLQCAASTGARPSARAPPRVPSAAVASPGFSGGARAPPEPEAYTSVRFSPPRITEVSGGTRAPSGPEMYKNVRFPPPRITEVSGGARAPPVPEAHTSVRFPPPRTTTIFSGTRAPPVPEAHTSMRFAPPRTTRVFGGTRVPRGPEAYTNVRFPPPRTIRVSGGTPAPPKPKARAGLPEPNFPPRAPNYYVPGVGTFYLPPPYPQTAYRGTSPEAHTSVRPPPPPRAPKTASTGTHDAVVAGAHEHEVRGAPAVPVYGGSAGGSDAPKPKVAPRSGARTAPPIPDSLSYGTPP